MHLVHLHAIDVVHPQAFERALELRQRLVAVALERLGRDVELLALEALQTLAHAPLADAVVVRRRGVEVARARFERARDDRDGSVLVGQVAERETTEPERGELAPVAAERALGELRRIDELRVAEFTEPALARRVLSERARTAESGSGEERELQEFASVDDLHSAAILPCGCENR